MEKASNSLKVQKKKQNIEDEAKSENSEENKPKKKYIVFLGNLPFDITKEEIEDHFKSISKSIFNIKEKLIKNFQKLEVKLFPLDS